MVVPGHSAVQVTLNGSSAGGAGFFNPGPGVPQRLVAALAGSGITVTGVAVASPTQLTLTLDTTAASLGAHALSISNPDGQTTSLASALTVQENQPPVAAGDAYSVRAFGTLNVPTPGVLGNDSDPNNGADQRGGADRTGAWRVDAESRRDPSPTRLRPALLAWTVSATSPATVTSRAGR